MYAHYFPSCPVNGPIEPAVPYTHLCFRGAVPQKCSQCPYLFEGECIRYIEDVGHFLYLDHGPCGIEGLTDPVPYENEFTPSMVEIPRKCATCLFRAVDRSRGFYCAKEPEKWGDLPRGLDWGSWKPEFILLCLPLPKVSTPQLSRFAYHNDLLAFLKEHRRLNPALSLDEAKADFFRFRRILGDPPGPA